jgi:hypothetical protein
LGARAELFAGLGCRIRRTGALIGLLLAGLLILPVTGVACSVAVGVLLSATIYRQWVNGLIQRVLAMGVVLLGTAGLIA